MNKMIEEILDEMKRVYLNDDRPWIIGYSGGKDSSLVVDLVYRMLKNLDEDMRKKDVYVVSSNTLIENPIILKNLKDNIDLINIGAKKDRLPLKAEIVMPRFDDSFWTNVIGKGFPTPKSATFRWCTQRLKIDPSNRFIESKVSQWGEAIVLLGVRKDESLARKESIEKREIDGYILNPHEDLKNTYVYSPIVELTTDQVWESLLADGGRNPWGGNNNELFELYKDGDGGECPFIMTKSNDGGEIVTPSCGHSRFGCWICTVVQEDKSLVGFIESGEEWLIPLIEFRDWILENRDNRDYRDKKQRTGRIYRMKKLLDRLTKEEKEMYLNEGYEINIDENDREFFWVKGLGPFNYEGRQLILRKLLETENQVGIRLIEEEELRAIEKIWNQEFDLKRNSLCRIYKEVKGESLPWENYTEPILEDRVIDEMDKLLEENGVSKELYHRLLILTEDHKHFSNKQDYKMKLDRLLSQQWLHQDIYDKEYGDED